MKTCTQCFIEKPLSEFYKSSGGRDGLRGNCKVCTIRVVSRKTSESRALHNATRNKRKYGITLEQHNAMLASQEGVCYICKRPPGKRALHIDHDHSCCPGSVTCGKCVRALLCHNCNVALGLLDENPEIIQAMLNYIVL